MQKKRDELCNCRVVNTCSEMRDSLPGFVDSELNCQIHGIKSHQLPAQTGHWLSHKDLHESIVRIETQVVVSFELIFITSKSIL